MESPSRVSPEAFEKIRQVFEERFQPWQITLPSAGLPSNGRGSIRQNGWTIHYRFGNENGQEFLEFFASHRMTNDTLQRIFAGGETKVLGFCQEFYTEGDKQAERECYEHNQKFYEEVKRKGLD